MCAWRRSFKRGREGWGGKNLLALLFPPRCLICSRPIDNLPVDDRLVDDLTILCARCEHELPALAGFRCHQCQEPLAEEGLDLCRACGTSDRGFDLMRALGPYAGGWGTLVRALKFEREKAVAEFIAKRMAACLVSQRPFGRIDVVSYVPMSRSAVRARGFNQARLLAAGVATKLDLPLEKLLVKSRRTLPQAGLSARRRRENLRGAFQLIRSGEGNVLLIDDIFTTGSTAEACAHTLKSGGYEKIFVLTAARA